MGFDLVSRLLFPAPASSYGVDSFPDELLWVPKTLDPHTCGPQDCIPCLFLPYSSARFMIFYLHSNAEDLGRCHGFCTSVRAQFQVHVFAVEYPGYGICPGGQSDETSVTENAFVAFRFIYEVLKWPLDSIIIMGRSIGCGPAISVTVRYQVSGLILVSPMLSVKDICWDVAGPLSYVMEERFPNKERVPLIRSPLLVVHGQKDVIVPCRHGVELYRVCRSRKLLVCPQDMEHNTNLLADVTYLVLPMLQFFALPDYCFEDVQVPSWAYDKRLSTHFGESISAACTGENDGLGRTTPLQPFGCLSCPGGCAVMKPRPEAIVSSALGQGGVVVPPVGRVSQVAALSPSTPLELPPKLMHADPKVVVNKSLELREASREATKEHSASTVVMPVAVRSAGGGGACAATVGISTTLAAHNNPASVAVLQPADVAAGPAGPTQGQYSSESSVGAAPSSAGPANTSASPEPANTPAPANVRPSAVTAAAALAGAGGEGAGAGEGAGVPKGGKFSGAAAPPAPPATPLAPPAGNWAEKVSPLVAGVPSVAPPFGQGSSISMTVSSQPTPPLVVPPQRASWISPEPMERTASRNRFLDVGRESKVSRWCAQASSSSNGSTAADSLSINRGGSASSAGSGREVDLTRAMIQQRSGALRPHPAASHCMEIVEDIELRFMAPASTAMPATAGMHTPNEGSPMIRSSLEELGVQRSPRTRPLRQHRPGATSEDTGGAAVNLGAKGHVANVGPNVSRRHVPGQDLDCRGAPSTATPHPRASAFLPIRPHDPNDTEPLPAGVILPEPPQSAPPAPSREPRSESAADVVAAAVAASTSVPGPLTPLLGPLSPLPGRLSLRPIGNEGPQASLRRLHGFVPQPRKQQLVAAPSPGAPPPSVPSMVAAPLGVGHAGAPL